jgi:hypothetical protein
MSYLDRLCLTIKSKFTIFQQNKEKISTKIGQVKLFLRRILNY